MSTGQEDPQEDPHQDEDQPDQARAEVPAGVSAPRRPRHRKGDTAKMVAVLARYGSQKEAALAAGISVREVRRREREPEIQRLVRAARRDQYRQWMAKMAEAGPKALDTLVELLGEDQAADMRFKASKEVLRAAEHNMDGLATREEFDELWAKFDALQDPDEPTPEP